MMLRLYAAAAGFAQPAFRRMLAKRAATGKEIPARLAEREGISSLPRPDGKLAWVHAASVGETMSVLPVLHALAGQGAKILLTTGTVTSARLAESRLPPGAIHQFVPLDVPAWVERFISHWQPDVAVFLESELWPNLLRGCDAHGIPRLLINARMSDKSARNWRRAPGTARALLGGFAAVLAQSATDAAKFRSLSVEVQEWGNLKFFTAPLPVDQAALDTLKAQLPGPAWLAASTHEGEEEIIATAHENLLPQFPTLITIIVPRHPERGEAVAALCGNAPRRSLGQPPIPGKIYVADTLGELGLFFRATPFAFIGNSLVGFGGHNIIEPALLARPALSGPHLENFKEPAEILRDAGMLAEVTDAASLAAAAASWLRACPDGAIAAACFASAAQLPLRVAGLIMGQIP
ncbi:MAG TPA: 3-deoxy-D-manno-octulosonic acid transferase [Acidocella sp.]|nr:3-deoxy-D-manno-octulosonic acid transferase [Acidocella sp.]